MTAQRINHVKSDKGSIETQELDAREAPSAEEEQDCLRCPSCGYPFITRSNGKQKLRTRILVFVGNGNTMGICPKCKTNLKVPVSLVLRDNAKGSL